MNKIVETLLLEFTREEIAAMSTEDRLEVFREIQDEMWVGELDGRFYEDVNH